MFVQSVIKKYKGRGTVTNTPRTDAPRKITTRACSKMARIAKKNPRIFKKELVDELAPTGINVTRQSSTHYEG